MSLNTVSYQFARILFYILAVLLIVAGLIMELSLTSAKSLNVQASEFTVTKTDDTSDGNCDSDCSLREAVIAANTTPGEDTIIIPSGVYSLTMAGTNENNSLTGDLDIKDNLYINGAGATLTIISGGELDRVFQIITGTTVLISGTTISNGREVNTGGGIYNSGTLTLMNSLLTNNGAGLGGGLYNNLGTVTLINVSVYENAGYTGGGGIYNNGGTIILKNSLPYS